MRSWVSAAVLIAMGAGAGAAFVISCGGDSTSHAAGSGSTGGSGSCGDCTVSGPVTLAQPVKLLAADSDPAQLRTFHVSQTATRAFQMVAAGPLVVTDAVNLLGCAGDSSAAFYLGSSSTCDQIGDELFAVRTSGSGGSCASISNVHGRFVVPAGKWLCVQASLDASVAGFVPYAG